MRRLVLIDAANTLYRAFFALPPLRNASGQPTGAVLGFANMLGKVVREEQPDAIAIAMDPKGGSFRTGLYPEYKANRDAQPEDLTSQFEILRELIAAWRLPMLEVPGFEADDVIASLVEQAPEDVEVVIVSTDKDLMQLCSDRVVLLDTVKDRRVGPAEVEERFGVPPERLLDLRALVGDPSDNIPGVKGIGEKGAAKLLAEWPDLETLLDHADEVKAKKAREGLQGQADAARLSKQLATLRTDVPLPPLDELAIPEADQEAVRELYERLEFTRLLDGLGGGERQAPARDVAIAVEAVTTKAGLAAAVEALASAERVAVVLLGDPERGGLVPEPVGVGLAGESERGVYLALGHGDLLDRPEIAWADVAVALEPLLAGRDARPWLARNTKRVQTLFAETGVKLPEPCFDVDLAAFLIDPAAPRTTPALASQQLGRTLRSFEDVVGRGAKATPPAELPVDAAAGWAAEEACALFALMAPLAARLEKDGLEPLFTNVELPLTRVLSAMERRGVRVDEAKLARLSEEYEGELSRIEGRITELAGETFTINSPKQLQRILFEKLKLPVIKKTKTGYSTDESVLEQLSTQHDLPLEILRFRQLGKLKSTYIDALPPLIDPATGRIHPSYHQTGAATGRLSSSHPNVQNIPIRTEEGVRIREAFVPAEGRTLLSADYSQVELRIVAHYSGDASLIEAFAEGADVHRRTAAEVLGVDPEDVTEDQRAHAKAINFGIIYGSSAFGIANQLGIAQAEARETIDAYFARYTGVRRFLDETIEQAKTRGYVTTLLGRRRYLPDLSSRNRVQRQAAERMAVNTVVQGTEADLIKKAMLEVVDGLADAGLAAEMILQVHDELVFEVAPQDVDAVTQLVRSRMEDVVSLDVPLVVDVGIGADWRAAH
jgi:DNA polymerase-1